MRKIIITSVFTVFCSSMLAVNAGINEPKLTVPQQVAEPVPMKVHTIEVNHGKPGASIALTYQVQETITAGETINVNLAFRSNKSEGQLRIEMNADTGMTLMNAPLFVIDLPSTSSDLNAQVQTTTNGLFYLNVTAKEFDAQGNGLRSRSFSVPIQVGPPVNFRSEELRGTEQSKEKIIEMPAERL
ncbi:hypothetical protein [Arenicella xantha]|uniref:Uncharacterized protein n=1 Tax=Arenicella xantha TaxID=644221 RepID=A0A395JGM9_9GAMM|nr:hypothetical protein [Arenicella xantha]RBP48542.1 hypothetical protein DFR28_10628 [Arenicella xantha]